MEFISSAREGDLAPFQELFEQPDATKKFEEAKDEYNGSTALHMAAANGHVELVKFLVSHIAESELKRIVNLANDSGNTALHWVSLTGELEVAKLLVEAGADPMLQNKGGKDSIYQAEEAGHEEVVDYLLGEVDMDVEAEEAEPEAGEGDAEAVDAEAKGSDADAQAADAKAAE